MHRRMRTLIAAGVAVTAVGAVAPTLTGGQATRPERRTTRRALTGVGLAAAAALAASTVAAAPVPASAEPAARQAAVWSQDFDGAAGSAPDPSVWNLETGAGGWGNGELQNYTTSRSNSALDGNGNLVITAQREGDGSYTSARLTTQNKYTAQYGRVEARIKIPRGQGIWPAFWMLGADLPTNSWPSAGEIDVMENVGFEPHRVHGTVHGPGYSGSEGLSGTWQHPQGWSIADDFHTFAVDWAPGSITWSVDGQVYHQVTPASTGGDPWVFDKPFFIILNVAVGGAWPGYPDGSTALPQRMVVDYVRVTQ